MLAQYLRSPSFKQYLPDWIFGIFLFIFFFGVTENAKPFERKFYINDPTIQFPFATSERVTDNMLYILSGIIPASLIVFLSFYQKKRKQLSQFDTLHLVSVSIVGLFVSYMFTAVITDILKVWIARPRPDFLARCGPKKKVELNKLVGVEVCTNPLGDMYLLDGMKSTPSGHSSLAFSGLLYLSLWLLGQFKLGNITNSLWSLLTAFTMPLLLASYIALSRTQDYRHHFFDVILGLLIGIIITLFVYLRLFPLVFSNTSDKEKRSLEEDILPK